MPTQQLAPLYHRTLDLKKFVTLLRSSRAKEVVVEDALQDFMAATNLSIRRWVSLNQEVVGVLGALRVGHTPRNRREVIEKLAARVEALEGQEVPRGEVDRGEIESSIADNASLRLQEMGLPNAHKWTAKMAPVAMEYMEHLLLELETYRRNDPSYGEA